MHKEIQGIYNPWSNKIKNTFGSNRLKWLGSSDALHFSPVVDVQGEMDISIQQLGAPLMINYKCQGAWKGSLVTSVATLSCSTSLFSQIKLKGARFI